MKIETKRCAFCAQTRTWTLESVLIEVNSRKEFKAAWKTFLGEVQRYEGLTRDTGGRDGQR